MSSRSAGGTSIGAVSLGLVLWVTACGDGGGGAPALAVGGSDQASGTGGGAPAPGGGGTSGASGTSSSEGGPPISGLSGGAPVAGGSGQNESDASGDVPVSIPIIGGPPPPAITFDEFEIPNPSQPGWIAAGPDGQIWFTHQSTAPSAISQVTTR